VFLGDNSHYLSRQHLHPGSLSPDQKKFCKNILFSFPADVTTGFSKSAQLMRSCSESTLNMHVILNGAQRSEESHNPKKDAILRWAQDDTIAFRRGLFCAINPAAGSPQAMPWDSGRTAAMKKAPGRALILTGLSLT
jgi:hypothetical protein